jgi:hypothetical protein
VTIVRWAVCFCPSDPGHIHKENRLKSRNQREPAVTGMNSKTSSLRPFCWRRGSELNRRIKVLQTLALPLGYRALQLSRY